MLGEKCTATVHFSPSIRIAWWVVEAAGAALGAQHVPRRIPKRADAASNP